MLVLSRKPGEKLIVGDNVAIEVIEVQGGKVRLGITAPDYVTIVREELLDVMHEWDRRKQGKLVACA